MIDIEKLAHELPILEARNITTSVTSMKFVDEENTYSKIAKKYYDTYNGIKTELDKLNSN